jgi:hypothetical protein
MNFRTETDDRLKRLDSVVNNMVTLLLLLGELLFAGRLLHTSKHAGSGFTKEMYGFPPTQIF